MGIEPMTSGLQDDAPINWATLARTGWYYFKLKEKIWGHTLMVETGGCFWLNQKFFFLAGKSLGKSFNLCQPLDTSWVKHCESRPWRGFLSFNHQCGSQDTWSGNTPLTTTKLCAPLPSIQLLPLHRYLRGTSTQHVLTLTPYLTNLSPNPHQTKWTTNNR